MIRNTRIIQSDIFVRKWHVNKTTIKNERRLYMIKHLRHIGKYAYTKKISCDQNGEF